MTAIFRLSKFLDGRVHLDYALLVISVFPLLCCTWLYAKSKRLSPPLPPGPWGLPIVGNLPFLKSELHSYFQGLAKKHGPIFKLWLGARLTIVVTSSELAQELFKSNDVIFANRDIPAVGPINTYGGTEMIWVTYGPKWPMLRKLCVSKILSNTVLESSLELRRQETWQTVAHLADRARVGSSVKLGEHIFSMIMNVVTQLLWGTTVKGEGREIVRAQFLELITEMNDLMMEPNIL